MQEATDGQIRRYNCIYKVSYTLYQHLHPLFQRIFCTPATSAPVERVFSQSGLMIGPHQARMGDTLLETVVYLKCNVNVV